MFAHLVHEPLDPDLFRASLKLRERKHLLPRLIIALIILVVVIAAMRKIRSRFSVMKPALEGKTVRCAHCSVYFPRDEAVVVAEKHYCSEEHARLGDS